MTRATEAQCQATIIEAAKRGGWLCHAERPARMQSGKWSTPIQGHAGFPDLVLISPDHRTIIVAELKRKPNKVEPQQWTWLDAFSDVGRYARCEFVSDLYGGLHVAVWWIPDDLDAICAALANGQVPGVGV